MKKFKKEKGITLIALIITIVVLLILAAVAIGTAQESNIVGYAQNAAGSFNQSKANEIEELASYQETIKKYITKGRDIEYYIVENNFVQKVDWNRSVIITYFIKENGYLKDAETPFERGNSLVDNVQVMLNDPIGSGIVNSYTIPEGAIPLYVITGDDKIVGAYIFEGKFFGMLSVQNNTNIYGVMNLVTESSKIAEIESKIANIK